MATPERFFEKRAKSKRLEFQSELTRKSSRSAGSFCRETAGPATCSTERGDFGNLFNNGGVSGAGQAAIVEAIATQRAHPRLLRPRTAQTVRKLRIPGGLCTRFDDRFAPRGWPVALGKPDIISMAYAGGPRATISSRVGTFAPYHHPQVWSSLDEARARARAVALALDVLSSLDVDKEHQALMREWTVS